MRKDETIKRYQAKIDHTYAVAFSRQGLERSSPGEKQFPRPHDYLLFPEADTHFSGKKVLSDEIIQVPVR